MKRKITSTAIIVAATAMLSACSLSAAPEATIAPVEKPPVEIMVFGDYAMLAGHTLYNSQNNAFSIQLPEGSTINDADPNNITVTVSGDFGTPDYINISRAENATVLDSEAKLMELLKNDNTIDITGFFVLKKEGAYEGYKYTYTSASNPQLKGIKSTYFSADGSAYIVTVTANNGGDEINMTNLNTIIDTFINYN